MPNSTLPELPTGSDVFSEAVRSVNRRGFHDTVPPLAENALLMAQLLRLTEEVGECVFQWNKRPGVFATELADIAIVLSQISWLIGQQPGGAISGGYALTVDAMMLALGDLARALRGCKSTYNEVGGCKSTYSGVSARVAKFNDLLFDLAEARGIDIEQAIAYKLTEDEQRGHLHGQYVPIAEELA